MTHPSPYIPSHIRSPTVSSSHGVTHHPSQSATIAYSLSFKYQTDPLTKSPGAYALTSVISHYPVKICTFRLCTLIKKFHPAYVAAVEGAEGLTAKAIVDNFTVVGPPDIVFPVVDEIKP